MHICAPHARNAVEARWVCRVPRLWSYGWLWASVWVLRAQPGSSKRTANDVNCWATSPASIRLFHSHNGPKEGVYQTPIRWSSKILWGSLTGVQVRGDATQAQPHHGKGKLTPMQGMTQKRCFFRALAEGPGGGGGGALRIRTLQLLRSVLSSSSCSRLPVLHRGALVGLVRVGFFRQVEFVYSHSLPRLPKEMFQFRRTGRASISCSRNRV